MAEDFDLFGQPVRAGAGLRGRPRYVPTEKDRNKIKLLLAFGWSGSRIANAVDLSLATMKRYFRAELKVRDAMRDRLDARRFEIAMEQANAGNIAALKELGKMVEKSDLMRLDDTMRDRQREGAAMVKPKEEVLGKKDAKKAAAQTAGEGSLWGSDLVPGLRN